MHSYHFFNFFYSLFEAPKKPLLLRNIISNAVIKQEKCASEHEIQ